MDKLTREQRSKNMKAVKGKDTSLEIALRKELWARGLRYRVNDRTVFGTPDLSFKSRKVAVFVDGEFWHGFDWENRKTDIKSNQQFWCTKIERNIQRDKDVNKKLSDDGWIVLRFWGREIKKNLSGCADIIEKEIRTYE